MPLVMNNVKGYVFTNNLPRDCDVLVYDFSDASYLVLYHDTQETQWVNDNLVIYI